MDGAECRGGADIILKKGYWRENKNSDLIIRCSDLPDNCLGGNLSYTGDNSCYPAHIGPLCLECDIFGTREGYGKHYSKIGISCADCV